MYSFTIHGFYLMKGRSELSSIFMSFFNEIKNQLEKIIRIFKSYNVEYLSIEHSSFIIKEYSTSTYLSHTPHKMV